MSRIDLNPSETGSSRYVVFAGSVRIAAGSLSDIASAARCKLIEDPNATVLAFDRGCAEVVDLDLRGSDDDVRRRYTQRPQQSSNELTAKRGRPKLGVVPREVTLLPRHWEWLAQQPGGASITLRKLVETAQKSSAGAAKARADATYRFMSATAGDRPKFEEAARALFAGDLERLRGCITTWPADIADELMMYAEGDAQ